MRVMEKDYPTQNVVNVPSRKVDDIIEELGSDVVIEVIKIDTQGFEPNVLSGLKKTLSQNRINYILIKFWPTGIGFLFLFYCLILSYALHHRDEYVGRER